MTDKEFKRLSRAQLIDIIYQFQLKEAELKEEIQRLSQALKDRRLRVSEAGNIAEAALEVNNVMQAAQAAAEQYLEEIRVMREETQENCRQLLEKARQEAEVIIEKAHDGYHAYDAALEAIVQEFGHNH